MSETRTSEVQEAAEQVFEPRAGLRPRDARQWLAFQRRFAWVPEVVGPLLESGSSPEKLMSAESVASKTASASLGGESPAQARSRIEREVAGLEALGVRILPRMLPGYPESLTSLCDAPGVLFLRGEVGCLDGPCVAIVGARAATRPAQQTAHRLARDLAACGVTIVSGLARGIDRAAHEGAIEGGGATVAVMASGIEEIYPPEHGRLASEILRTGGAILTEMPMNSPPRRAHFPLRNRLISGLSTGVIVVEARRRSGSLITVRHALAQGREVFVVPGPVNGPFAAGTNLLLREGARPVLCAGDVIEDLGWSERVLSPQAPAPALGPGNPKGAARDARQQAILTLLAAGPIGREELIGRLDLGSGDLAEALLELELADRVVEDRDGLLQLNWG